MRHTMTQLATHQLRMPGMSVERKTMPSATCCNIAPGQSVVYVGSISGGPRFGSAGVVKEARRRLAVVDMGTAGVWNIPYHFLTLPPTKSKIAA